MLRRHFDFVRSRRSPRVLDQPVGPRQPFDRCVLYEGARLIPGDGSAPIADSAFLVENGTIAKVGQEEAN